MKKKIFLISVVLAFVLVAIIQTNVFATTNTLEAIAEKFNNSEMVASYGAMFDREYSAEVDGDTLTVLIATGEMGDAIDFVLDGSVLTGEGLTGETIFIAGALADCVGQINGEYEDGELFQNFNLFADEIHNYTVEEEGFELIEGEETYIVKIDIEKTVPLIDLSEYYLKPEDFDIIAEIIEEGTTGNQNSRNARLAYNVSIGGDQDEIWIGEVDEITESTYKSILSALEVMYGEKAVEWFQDTYPDLSMGNYIFNGFEIMVDEEIDLEEHPMFSGTKVVIVTLDSKYMNYRFKRTEYIGETIDKGNKTITLDFVKDESYKLGFFDSVSSSDAAFLYKYILEPVFMASNAEIKDNTAYFDIVNEKIVVGDKDNSIFKLVIGDEDLQLLPSKTDVEKTTAIAKHSEVKAEEYKNYEELEEALGDIDFSKEVFRYLQYNVTVNVVYGTEVEEEQQEEQEEESKKTDYKTLEGANQVVDISKNKAITFRFDIEYAKFQKDGKVYMDEKIVDSSKYTSKEGSTTITFNEDYVQDLTEGEHTLKVEVADGEVSTTFKVENNAEKETSNPKTGDNIIVYTILLALSFVGIAFIEIKNKK